MSGVAHRERTDPSHADELFRSVFENQFAYVWTSLRRLGVAERDREDLVNEVFFRVHRQFRDYDRDRPIRPWLFAFIVRIASDYRRLARHRLQLGIDDEQARHSARTAEECLAQREDYSVVQRALEELDFDRRVVFVMHELDEQSIPHVARVLEIPVQTAYSRLRAAHRDFADAVKRLKGEDR